MKKFIVLLPVETVFYFKMLSVLLLQSELMLNETI